MNGRCNRVEVVVAENNVPILLVTEIYENKRGGSVLQATGAHYRSNATHIEAVIPEQNLDPNLHKCEQEKLKGLVIKTVNEMTPEELEDFEQDGKIGFKTNIKMTAKQVLESVAEVSRLAAADKDYELAHIKEDNLREAVLKEIAEGAVNAQELAAAVLKTGEIDFPRWCA